MINISHHNLDFNGKKLSVFLEKYSDLKNIGNDLNKNLEGEIHALLINCWGAFPEDFVRKHIFGADIMIVARVEEKCIGLCVMSIREVLGLRIHYIEFLLIDKEFQTYGVGSFLFSKLIRQEILRNSFLILFGRPMEIFFITPNIRILSRTSRLAAFTYPNPYLADENGKIPPADDETWKIALELLQKSDNPDRELDREALVLKDSYAKTPWLIYNNDTAPWHSSEKINVFAKKYLGYDTGEDREFMVRAQINLFSILRYLLQPKK